MATFKDVDSHSLLGGSSELMLEKEQLEVNDLLKQGNLSEGVEDFPILVAGGGRDVDFRRDNEGLLTLVLLRDGLIMRK